LPELERLYVDGLMRTADAVEGVRAFLEKRPPVWVNE
jgi:enoyl-CoA hydratase/carnithine racemase